MEENNILIQERNKKYNEKIKQVTPTHNVPAVCIKAFITGGVICTLGQFIINMAQKMGASKDEAGLWSTILLVLLSVVLTALNIFPSIVKWGGAGALVPITGFANGVCAPAIEFKKDASDIIGTRSKKPRKIKGFR